MLMLNNERELVELNVVSCLHCVKCSRILIYLFKGLGEGVGICIVCVCTLESHGNRKCRNKGGHPPLASKKV